METHATDDLLNFPDPLKILPRLPPLRERGSAEGSTPTTDPLLIEFQLTNQLAV